MSNPAPSEIDGPVVPSSLATGNPLPGADLSGVRDVSPVPISGTDITINISEQVPLTTEVEMSHLESVGQMNPVVGTGGSSSLANGDSLPGADPSSMNGPIVEHPSCEGQIKNLVDMQIREGEVVTPDDRKRLVALEALREWKEAQSGLQGKVERRTKQADKLINEIYQLVGLYSVFVGVVFTAAVQSQTLKCQHIWSPLLLCIFAWLIIFVVTKKRLKKYIALRETIKSEEKSRAAVYNQISYVKVFGYKGFDFTEHVDEKRSTVITAKPKRVVCGIKVTASVVIPSVLTALTIILAGSFIHIMCLKEISSKL